LEDLSLHILDIAENSIAAGAQNITIRITQDTQRDRLVLVIVDDGRGMDEETVRKVTDPFFTTKSVRRVGLGLPLLEEAARMANGNLSIRSRPGRGTRIKATFGLNHIDRKPMGDIAQTLKTLIVAHPEIRIRFHHRCDGEVFVFDTKP